MAASAFLSSIFLSAKAKSAGTIKKPPAKADGCDQ
jgi:hypothetical protein